MGREKRKMKGEEEEDDVTKNPENLGFGFKHSYSFHSFVQGAT